MSCMPTDSSAISAHPTLHVMPQSLRDAQTHISTGPKKAGASDNASTRAIAGTMTSDDRVLSCLGDSPIERASFSNVAAGAITGGVKTVNDGERAVDFKTRH